MQTISNKNEEWRAVKGFEGLYAVSDMGRIKSLNYRRTGREQVLKLWKHNKGYLGITLLNNGKRETLKVHRLVAEAFIPNPNNLPQINHIDEDKTNNVVSNLEWCDSAYNNAYGSHRTKYAYTVFQYTTANELVKEWESTKAVKRETGWEISHAAKNNKIAFGYRWSYSKM